MKNNIKIIIFVAVVVIGWLMLDRCNEKPIPKLKDNTALFESLEVYKSELAVLKNLNDSLLATYQNNKNVKDSIVYDIQTRYKTYYDTITNDTIECLPKPHVDTLINTYEGLLADADTLIKVKSLTIDNLTVQNEIKDTIISNYQDNELFYKQEIKKQKKKKWKFFAVGFGTGYFAGKLF